MAQSVTPRRLTVKQERFAQACASGLSHADAYRQSYDCQGMSEMAVHTEAYRLSQHPQVTLRIEALEQEALEANSITPSHIVANLKRNAEMSRELDTPQMSASNHAYEMLARISRMPGYDRQAGDTQQVNVQVNLIEQLSKELSVDELKALRAQAIEARQETDDD